VVEGDVEIVDMDPHAPRAAQPLREAAE
jgi:hypothetical protein